MTRLILSASGTEKLKFGSGRGKDANEVASLPGGHRIDMDCAVRYGFLGEPAGPDKVAADASDTPQPGAHEDAARMIAQALGGPFIVFRDKVQKELKLADKQDQKLREKFPDYVQETMKVLENLQDTKPQEREKAMQEHRRKSEEKLTAFLKGVLDAKQQKRLFQVQLQQAGAFGLMGENEAFVKLKITDEQRKQIMGVAQEMHQKIEPLMKDAQSGGNPAEIRPKVMKIRRQHESRIEALLSDAQKKQWKEMLGKPLDLGD
jgi:hypothetical protein